MPRPKIPSLSKDAVKNAKKVLSIIAPHVPADSLPDVVVAEAAINYALEQANVLEQQLSALKNAAPLEESQPIINE